jgi:cell division protein FtsI (penicillin-binding protein 3)
VFKAISDKVFATNLDLQKSLTAPRDTTIERVPVVAPGDWQDAGKLLKTLNVPVNSMKVKSGWARLNRKGDLLNAEPVNPADSVLPSFIGMGLKDVLPVLENMGYKVRVKGSGRIVSQSPPAGAWRDSVGVIELKLTAL